MRRHPVGAALLTRNQRKSRLKLTTASVRDISSKKDVFIEPDNPDLGLYDSALEGHKSQDFGMTLQESASYRFQD